VTFIKSIAISVNMYVRLLIGIIVLLLTFLFFLVGQDGLFGVFMELCLSFFL